MSINLSFWSDSLTLFRIYISYSMLNTKKSDNLIASSKNLIFDRPIDRFRTYEE